MPHILTLSVVVIVALGLAPAAPIPKAANKPLLYFPTTVGSKWVYESKQEEEIRVVTRVQEKDGAKIVTVEESTNGIVGFTTCVAVSEKGLLTVPTDEYGEPIWLLQLPVKPGKRWQIDHWEKFKLIVTWSVFGPEEIEVPAGKYKALRVESEYKGMDSIANGTTYWFAPGVGPVKIGSQVLKSFTPGKN